MVYPVSLSHATVVLVISARRRAASRKVKQMKQCSKDTEDLENEDNEDLFADIGQDNIC